MAASIVQSGKTKARYIFGYILTKRNVVIGSNNSLKYFSSSADNNNNDNSIITEITDKPNVADAATVVDKKRSIKSIPDNEIRKSVFISQSYDVFTNLALEDWIYKNFDFTNHHILMLWANNPCVVIGRHQNPYVEANISNLEKNGITLARRNSGGGAVYHDRGNLNCTFFTPRDRYNRKYNLNLITRALFREWAIKAELSERDDITLGGKKVSL